MPVDVNTGTETRNSEPESRNSSRKLRIAFIVPRFHESVVGGAEKLTGDYADILKGSHQIDIITTNAVTTDWQPELETGRFETDGMTVYRFDAGNPRTSVWNDLNDFWARKAAEIRERDGIPQPRIFGYADSQKKTLTSFIQPYYTYIKLRFGNRVYWSSVLQEEWIRQQGPHSTELLAYLADNQYKYDLFFFFSYLYSPVFFGSLLVPFQKRIFVPMLHNEDAALLPVFSEQALRMKYLLWNTSEEKDLARKIWKIDNGEIIGDFVENRPFVNRSREHNIIYAGRLDSGKGVGELISYFQEYSRKSHSDLQLRVAGRGPLEVEGRNIDPVGFVSNQELSKTIYFAKATAIPSRLESFSLLLLESLGQGTPVIVPGDSPVLCGHVKRSDAGWIYHSKEEFFQILSDIEKNPGYCEEKGRKGADYIQKYYTREIITRKLQVFVEKAAASAL